jgi:uncharacterized protein (TIRG00374 family)
MRIVRHLIALLITAALVSVFLFYFRNDLAAALEEIRHAFLPLMLLSVVLQVVHVLVRAVRWRLLLAPVKRDVSFYNLFSTTAIGYTATILFPFRLGEVIRPLLLAGRERMSRSAALATVGVERVLDFLTVLLFLSTYLLFFADDLHAGATGSASWARMVAGARIAAGAALLALPLLFLFARFGESWLLGLQRRLAPVGGGKLEYFLEGAHKFVHGMRALNSPALLIRAVGMSLLTWLAIAAATWAGVLSLDGGFAFPFRATLLLVPFLAVGVVTPSPGGAGGYHIICSVALEQLFGASRPAAAATAIVLWFLAWTPIVIMGLFFQWRAGLSLRDLKSMARPSSRTDPPLQPLREGDPT